MDRRTTLKWVLAASAALPLLTRRARAGAPEGSRRARARAGYGTDPDLLKGYKPGDIWPLTFTKKQRALAAVLCDLIIPADEHSPSASALGVVAFLDEWVSAPYPKQQADRREILSGLTWLEEESQRRFGHSFLEISDAARLEICDDICYVPKASIRLARAARFFARYRDLTAGGFYTSPEGTKDLQYVGNTPLARFDGPPLEVLKRVGLA